MATVIAFEAKTRFGELLDRVSRGEEIVITRHEKPVARIVPEGRPGLAEVRQAAEELHVLHREMAKRRGFKPLTDREIKKAIAEGRPWRRSTRSRSMTRPTWNWPFAETSHLLPATRF